MAEGKIPYRGFETWYREEGGTDPGKLPVLCLNGGPGAAHDDPEYEAACMVFYERHVCRVVPFPDCVQRTFAAVGEVYETMNGPSEFHVVGTIRDWDVTARLGEIRVPTLVVTGEHDEATPAINRTVSSAIPGAESVVFPDASHMAHVEHTDDYVALLDRFVSVAEAG